MAPAQRRHAEQIDMALTQRRHAEQLITAPCARKTCRADYRGPCGRTCQGIGGAREQIWDGHAFSIPAHDWGGSRVGEPGSPPVQVKLDCSDYPCHDSASATGHHAKPDPRKLRAGFSGLSSNPWQPATISKQGSEPSSTQSRVLSPAQPILADLTLSFRTNQRQGSGPTPAHHVC